MIERSPKRKCYQQTVMCIKVEKHFERGSPIIYNDQTGRHQHHFVDCAVNKQTTYVHTKAQPVSNNPEHLYRKY